MTSYAQFKKSADPIFRSEAGIKKTGQALLDEKERFRILVEQSPVAISLTGEDGTFLYINPKFRELFGYSLEDVPDEKAWFRKAYPDPAYRRRVMSAWIHDKDQARVGEIRSRTFKVTCKDGSEKIIRFRPVAMETGERLAFCEDTTERKRAEQTLLESERRYRLLAENVADGVVMVQKERMVFANRSLTHMIGYPLEQLLDMDPALFVLGDQRARFVEFMNRDDMFRIQVPCVRQDGREIWLDIHQNRIMWQDRPAVLATVRDITEDKIREEMQEEERLRLEKENVRLRGSLGERYRFGNIVGKSPAMQEVYELIVRAAYTDATVVIYGESGTGKEIVARTIHAIGDRQEKAFVPVNCGAIPEPLFESEFFGYQKGAFTGANANKHGYFDLADGGTLFLDEVGELSVNMQVKLLRAIDGGGYTPVGGGEIRKTNIRIVAATNRDLKNLVKRGAVREDFFYRVHIIPIYLPALRERREDIPLLIDHFIHEFGGKLSDIPAKVMETLYHYDWPGNVRELQNVLQRYLAMKQLDFLQGTVQREKGRETDSTRPSHDEAMNGEKELRQAVHDFERSYIHQILNHHQWHRGRAAQALGIPPRTLYRKMKKLRLVPA